ncbi:hypothetical protein ABZS29_19035 [Kribbella sp. NPDC005582]|uniref:beta family protein n=1 Tax=Kribbella sp. NPDC005582 TaxID=3156893 RepID=UPI0033B5C405
MTAPSTFDALVLLRAKKGELAALARVAEDRGVQPVLALDHDPNGSVDGLLDRVEAAARNFWQLGRAVMLDATNMATAPGGTGEILERLARRLNAPLELFQSEVPFVPVADGGMDDSLLARIGTLAGAEAHGCALRIRARGTPFSSIDRAVTQLGVEPADLDLILDAGYVPGPDDRLVDDLLELVGGAAQYAGLRSISVLSGSVPKTLDRIDQWEQPRFEEGLWRSVRDAGAAHLRFGDYGAVHPVASSAPWRSKHISLKYTCADHWFYLRERIMDPDLEDARVRTVRAVSSQLVASGSFCGAEYSWGDHEVAAAANGAGRGLGDASKPVAIATSHHLAYLGDFAAAA